MLNESRLMRVKMGRIFPRQSQERHRKGNRYRQSRHPGSSDPHARRTLRGGLLDTVSHDQPTRLRVLFVLGIRRMMFMGERLSIHGGLFKVYPILNRRRPALSSVARHDRASTYPQPRLDGECLGAMCAILSDACHNSVFHNSCICTFEPLLRPDVGRRRCNWMCITEASVATCLPTTHSRQ